MHYMMGPQKCVSLWRLFLSSFERRLHLEYFLFDGSDNYGRRDYDEIGSESVSDDRFGNILGAL